MRTWGDNLLFPTILGLGVYCLLWLLFAVIFNGDLYDTMQATTFAYGSVNFDTPFDYFGEPLHWTRTP